ncbi:isochorismatase hydrolase [Marinobacter algicola DG893]|uniref:Isochorismatase hydrolase n=1 Tax=Marinobacter algicola DG893 TaxID=443152 RepID=A6EWB1_9GAMM|nr:isochorismatase hydrolase [Marinobacter algicola DG893]
MMMKADESTLVLIDLQKKLMPVISHGDLMLAESVRLAQIAKLLYVPVIATEQIPEKLGHNDEQISDLADRTLTKTHFDACGGGADGGHSRQPEAGGYRWLRNACMPVANRPVPPRCGFSCLGGGKCNQFPPRQRPGCRPGTNATSWGCYRNAGDGGV